jgi:RNA polymerase sigma-70 factor (ECF subfamily)
MADDAADDELMASLATGDAEALQGLFRRHGRDLLNFLYRLTGDRATAEDLAQESFLRVYRHASRYVQGNSFRAWLYAIARNLALQEKRTRALLARTRPPEACERRPPAPDGERRELLQAIQRGIEGISEPFRSALLLCVLNGLTYEEAAQACGCSVKTLSSRLARGREQFRRLVMPYLANGDPVRPEGNNARLRGL